MNVCPCCLFFNTQLGGCLVYTRQAKQEINKSPHLIEACAVTQYQCRCSDSFLWDGENVPP